MLNANQAISDNVRPIASKIGTANSTPLVTEYVKPKTRRHLLIARLGDMAAETIDVAIYKASDSGGTGAASLKAATQLAAHASNNDNIEVLIELAEQELDPDKPYIAGRIVTGAGVGGTCCLELLGSNPRADNIEDVDRAGLVLKR